MSLLKTLIAVIGAIFAGYLTIWKQCAPSNTRITVTEADRNNVYVNVVNKGWKKSYLRKAVLTFGELPIEPREVRVGTASLPEATNGVNIQGDETFGLYVPGLQPKLRSDGTRHTREEVEAALARNRPVMLILEIEESSGMVTRQSSFPASLLRQLLQQKVIYEEL